MKKVGYFQKTTRKKGTERFILNSNPLPISILDFWQWSSSDLFTNTNRGKLAEFIVANTLGIEDSVRNDWLPYDLVTKEGIKVEVKTSAYLQNWYQTRHSKIVFDIAPKRSWNPATNKLSQSKKRNSEVYIFCLHKHKNIETIDVLNLNKWEFFILPTEVLENKVPIQKSISLSSLINLNPIQSDYGLLKNKFDSVTSSLKVG